MIGDIKVGRWLETLEKHHISDKHFNACFLRFLALNSTTESQFNVPVTEAARGPHCVGWEGSNRTFERDRGALSIRTNLYKSHSV